MLVRNINSFLSNVTTRLYRGWECMGIFIALSGLDGSGKSTQAELLSDMCRVKGMNVNVLHLKTMKSDKYLLKIKRKLQQYIIQNNVEDTDELRNIGSALLFYEKVNDKVLSSLHSYDLTIIDRYCESALCYHYLEDGLYPSVQQIYDTLVKPDVNIFLDLPPNECYKRIANRKYWSLFETPEYLEKAYTFYQTIRGNFTWIDATKSIEDITKFLVSTLENNT
ncbi:dTMP kinase [Clostridium beijerinckii]|uniref:dTMP kinase n=1 Tax=Clostridium beijerinckii TaxID=1520 RepID=UPI0022E0E63D|nr:AAA family ATPase [Clostridium beijerinckii]